MSQVTAILTQQPRSRPMAHEPGPIQCVASDWLRPGATQARLRFDPSVKRASQAMNMNTRPPVRFIFFLLSPVIGVGGTRFYLLFEVKKVQKIFKQCMFQATESGYCAHKKTRLKRGIRHQPDKCRVEWTKAGMALKSEVERTESGMS